MWVPTISDGTLYAFGLAFLAGLLGSLHCALMCGPLRMMAAGRSSAAIPYHLGRLMAYALLGAILGGLGARLSLVPSVVLATTLMVLLLSPAGKRLSGRAFQALSLQSPFTIGLGSALLPCGLLHGWLGSAVLSGSAAKGSILLLILWVTGMPALELMGRGAREILWPLQSRWPRGLPLALGVLALVPLALRAPSTSPSSERETPLQCHPLTSSAASNFAKVLEKVSSR